MTQAAETSSNALQQNEKRRISTRGRGRVNAVASRRSEPVVEDYDGLARQTETRNYDQGTFRTVRSSYIHTDPDGTITASPVLLQEPLILSEDAALPQQHMRQARTLQHAPELVHSCEHVISSHLHIFPDFDLVDILCSYYVAKYDPSEIAQTSPGIIHARATEQLAYFVLGVAKVIDSWVPHYGNQRQPEFLHLVNSREQLWNFLFVFYEQLAVQSSERQCARLLVAMTTDWVLSDPPSEAAILVVNVSARVARFVDGLGFLHAKLARSAWDELHANHALPSVGVCLGCTNDLQLSLSGFFHLFRVDSSSGEMRGCVSDRDPHYSASDFRIRLVDNYGELLNLLYHLSRLKQLAMEGQSVSIAVDCEGVRLSRSGQLALLQIALSTDPATVYIVDIVRLGSHAFNVATHTGTSIKRVLEDPDILKAFFDPRHDVDALYHQFDIAPVNVFDLQLAEVAARRAKGLTVRYVLGLFRCLHHNEVVLTNVQKNLAEKIDEAGKSLFEPEHGGSYDVFLQRPLQPGLLVYSAHDARYLLPLLEHFIILLGSTEDNWWGRVCVASDDRARWFLHPEYTMPTPEAPVL